MRPDRILVHPLCQREHDALQALARTGQRQHATLWRSYQAALWRLDADLQAGEVVRRGRIPRYFAERYDADNLYVMDLAGFHRLAYTIVDRDVFLLDILGHPEYDRIFGFRRK